MFSNRRYSLTRAALHGLTVLGILFAAAASTSPAYAVAPGNNSISNAIKITTAAYNGTVADVAGATTDAADPIISCGVSQHEDSVWYTFTPSSSGEVKINTINSQYDTILAVFKGTPNALIEMGCNDNSGGVTSAITLPLRGGVKYYIEVVRKAGTAIDPTDDMRISYTYVNKVVLWGKPLGKKWDASRPNLFAYSAGWQKMYPVLGALEGNIQISNNVNNNAIAYFDGGSFDLTYATGPDMGNLKVYVDNVLQVTIGQFNGTFSYPNVWSSPAYSDNLHKLELRHATGPSKVNLDYITVYSFPDVVPPAKINTLTTATGASTGKITLKWKAVGDDGMVGTATRYKIRYFPFTGAAPSCTLDWGSGTPYTYGLPTPLVAGTQQQITLSGLVPGLRYDFCMAAVDEVGNMGVPSNRAWATATAGTPYGTGTYDDAHVGWSYVGNWELVKNPDARYNTVHVSSKIGDTASFYFTGSQFVFTYLTKAIGGLMDLYIDGVYTTTIDQYTFYPNSFYYTSPILANGPHLVKFVHMTQTQVTVDQIYVWAPADGGPPDPITDLAAVPGANNGEVDLSWTSTGDDPGNVGKAKNYEIRYSTTPINNLVDWDYAQPVGGVFPPSVNGGAVQNVTATGLTPGARYFFAVRSFDNAWYDVISNTVASNVQYTGAYAAPGLYQESHSIWQFSTIIPGWITINDANASGGAYRRITNAPAGSLARFWFNGTKFRLFFLKDKNYGKLVVYVDGKKRGTINQFNSVPLWKQSWLSPVFAAGNHVVEFRVQGTRANVDYIRIYP
ncbi:MAG: hypothetical protein C4583_13770 [Anaerolineaceae bacterium]|nr:MAG: hypothetical protein C4583_13770 [Anaerolineaceae bacterium]